MARSVAAKLLIAAWDVKDAALGPEFGNGRAAAGIIALAKDLLKVPVERFAKASGVFVGLDHGEALWIRGRG